MLVLALLAVARLLGRDHGRYHVLIRVLLERLTVLMLLLVSVSCACHRVGARAGVPTLDEAHFAAVIGVLAKCGCIACRLLGVLGGSCRELVAKVTHRVSDMSGGA